ncbi:hypothetical protein G6514_001417 [Epicoccum nigrum]|nr:hypothetical protein G6514_001417 [Epicoccum nigrum]
MSEAPPVYIREIRVKVTSILAVRVPYQGMTSNRDIVEDFPCDIIARSFLGHGQVMLKNPSRYTKRLLAMSKNHPKH